MKQLKHRTIFVLIFALLLLIGAGLFCVLYAINGRSWASSPVNMAAYSNGRLAEGEILDRNGTLLYDCEDQSYADSSLLRKSTLHLIGDLQGNIATGARKIFSKQLVSYNPITGLSSTGNKLYLSIDAQLNSTAYKALDGRAGTVAVYNYKTGEIVCMVSSPAYDPTDEDEVAAVEDGDSDYAGAYMNRFLQSTFTPGSIFKVITAAAALENLDTDSFTYSCDGVLTINGEKVTCPHAHGDLDFQTALAKSCNGAFATLATQVGGKTLEKYAKEAGLTSKVNVNGLNTAAGSFTAGTSDNDVGWSGVGQYKDLVNPCAELTLMGCIAQGGSAATPRLLKSVTSSKGLPVAHVTTETSKIGWKADTCDKIRTLMHNNVTSNYSKNLDFGGLNVCAKSGTAEVGTSKPHAWFVGFVEDSAYPYAFVVVVENGGWGSSVAGGVAASLLKAACQ